MITIEQLWQEDESLEVARRNLVTAKRAYERADRRWHQKVNKYLKQGKPSRKGGKS